MKITYTILALLFIAILVTWARLPEISSNDRVIKDSKQQSINQTSESQQRGQDIGEDRTL